MASSPLLLLTFYLNLSINYGIPKTCLNYRKADWELIRAHLATLDWDDIFSGHLGSCSMLWQLFKNNVDFITRSHVPLLKIPCNSNNSPWFNSYLRRLLRTKQRKWKKYRSSLSQAYLVEYRQYCKFVSRKIFEARRRYERRKFEARNDNGRAFFK